ncbi:MAG: DUF4276 family protein [Ardenticatenaceae bacterium]
MVKQIRIYVEGGGDSRNQKAQIRQGFSKFLRKALGKNIKVIACGSRTHTFRDFKNALKRHPNAFNVLLVDSEGPVRKIPWEHLRERDGWQKPPHTTNEQCHLMVQMMEAWLIADLKALKEFYQQGFNANPIPKTRNIEKISKKQLEQALKSATKKTKKGTYHKMKHGPIILARIDVNKVRAASAHCDRLLTVLAKKLGS